MKKHLLSYAEYLNISPKKFSELGVLNPLINQDIQLFIDPRLLKKSNYEIFNKNAVAAYDDFYKNLANSIRAFLKISNDKFKLKAKKNIINKLTAKEPVGLGLGYTRNGTKGQGVGNHNATILFENALEIYENLPEIGEEVFSLLSILSEGIGADYIGDITANIIWKELAMFTEYIAKQIGIPVESFWIKEQEFFLPKHPNSTIKNKYPLLLVPKEILSDLPKDADMEDVLTGYADENEKIRTDVNEKILNILKHQLLNKTEKQNKLFDLLKNDAELISLLTQHMAKLDGNKYDFEKDTKSIIIRDRLLTYLKESDFKIDICDNLSVINYIIERFEKFVINNNKLKRELLFKDNGKHKPESAWQQVFHTFISEFLYWNNIDVIPEKETGSGPVDFCFSQGSKMRVLVELKLSTNAPIKGLTKQLEKYKECTDNVKAAYFICINVHKEKTTQKIAADLLEARRKLNLDTKIVVIDGNINQSASNLRLF